MGLYRAFDVDEYKVGEALVSRGQIEKRAGPGIAVFTENDFSQRAMGVQGLLYSERQRMGLVSPVRIDFVQSRRYCDPVAFEGKETTGDLPVAIDLSSLLDAMTRVQSQCKLCTSRVTLLEKPPRYHRLDFP